jgi:curved DNA-binding protein CbpA
MQDHYKVLGVNENATPEEIKKAYRKKALETHPDKNSAPDAKEQFQALNEANEILSDAEKRANYNREFAEYHRKLRNNENAAKTAAGTTPEKEKKKEEPPFKPTFTQHEEPKKKASKPTTAETDYSDPNDYTPPKSTFKRARATHFSFSTRSRGLFGGTPTLRRHRDPSVLQADFIYRILVDAFARQQRLQQVFLMAQRVEAQRKQQEFLVTLLLASLLPANVLQANIFHQEVRPSFRMGL